MSNAPVPQGMLDGKSGGSILHHIRVAWHTNDWLNPNKKMVRRRTITCSMFETFLVVLKNTTSLQGLQYFTKKGIKAVSWAIWPIGMGHGMGRVVLKRGWNAFGIVLLRTWEGRQNKQFLREVRFSPRSFPFLSFPHLLGAANRSPRPGKLRSLTSCPHCDGWGACRRWPARHHLRQAGAAYGDVWRLGSVQ